MRFAFTGAQKLREAWMAQASQAGATVFVNGAGFMQGIVVHVGGMVLNPTSVAASLLTFSMPAGTPCNTLLSLVAPTGQAAAGPVCRG